MTRRQTIPEQWLILPTLEGSSLAAARQLKTGSGVIVIGTRAAAEVRRLRRIAGTRNLRVVIEAEGDVARVHNVAELRAALLRRTPLVLLSPMFPTRSHPRWGAIPSMRAAALARLDDRRLLALGGMNARRYAKIAALGFIGWAGISAFRT